MTISPTRRQSIAHLASRQYGHVTRLQLLGLGVAATTIDAWVRDEVLVVVHRGVYAAGYRRVEPVAQAKAAVLAAGRGAVLSHDSALALWGLRRWPLIHEVLVDHRVRRPGILAHRSSTLRPGDCTIQLGVPVTRAARAIADVRARLTDDQHVRLVNEARLRHILTADEAHRLLGHDRNPTRSRGEDELWRWFVRHGFDPLPLIGVIVNGHEVDALFNDAKLIVELDHAATHSDPRAVRRDRAHDRADRDLGYRTERYVVEDLTDAEADRLKRILAERRAAAASIGPGAPVPPPSGPPAC